MQTEICKLQYTNCNMQTAICKRKYANYYIQFHIQFEIGLLILESTQICMMQFAYCSLHIAVSIFQFAYFSLQIAVCILQFAYCSLHISVCILQFAYCSLHFQSAYCSLLEFEFESETQCGIKSETDSGTQYQFYVDSRSKNPISN